MKQAHIKIIDIDVIDVKSPDEWCLIHQVIVIDPDGWRNAGVAWETLVTEEEFLVLLTLSTIAPLSPRREEPVEPAAESEPARPAEQQPAPDESASSRPDSSTETTAQK